MIRPKAHPAAAWAVALIGSLLTALPQPAPTGTIQVSPNRRFLEHEDGRPFFWLGDTAWLLFQKLDRAETGHYLEDRRAKGFNVIQVMVLHTVESRSAGNAAALVDGNPAMPLVTPGNRPGHDGEYDYWDHVEWVVDMAAMKGIYVAMVPAWGSIVKSGRLHQGNVEAYTRFLARRFRNRPNVIWLVGGDLQGDIQPEVWRAMGRTIKQICPHQLVTYHPFGRTQSSTWFHAENWLDFNMFQSGHRRYDQDTSPGAKGEDNWRYVLEDLARQPPKPTIDGEPSYEGIPQGLHDPKEPLWTDRDVRRYAYWSVLAGAFGHTYGHASVMQMRKSSDARSSYGAVKTWDQAINDPGAGQMQHLKRLVLSRPVFERVHDQALIAGEAGERYQRVLAARGRDYIFAYTFTGRAFDVRMGRIGGKTVRAWWFNPRDGRSTAIGALPNRGIHRFQPPGVPGEGHDWVLVLDNATRQYGPPGANPN